MQYVSENGTIDWRQVQINAAIAAMQALIGNNDMLTELESCRTDPDEGTTWDDVAFEADSYAEELVKRLKLSIPTTPKI